MTESPSASGATPRSGRVRSIAALLVFIIGFLMTPVALVGYWGHRTVTDAERYIETVGPLAYSEEVQDSLSVFLTEKIQDQVKPEELVEEIFAGVLQERPRLQLLVPIVAGAVDSLIAEVVDRIVRSEQFRELWNLANVAAQKALMAILEGRDDGAVKLEGDEIVLDISVLFDAVKAQLVERGLGFAANITIEPSNERIVLLEAPQLAQLRTIYAFTSPVLEFLIVITLLVFLGAILLARRRARMVAWTGVAFIVSGLGLVIALTIGRDVFVNQLADTPFGPASDKFYSQLFLFLMNSGAATIVIGIIVAAVGWFLSGARAALEVRSAARRSMAAIGNTVPAGPIVDASPWFARNARWVRVGIAVLFVALTLIGSDISVARTVIAALVCLLLLGVLQVLVSLAERTTSDEARSPLPQG